MKVISDTKQEREITITMTEAEWREIQQYARYYIACVRNLSDDAVVSADRLETKLGLLNLGERRDWDKLFL